MNLSAHKPTNELCTFQTPTDIQLESDDMKTLPGCTNHYSSNTYVIPVSGPQKIREGRRGQFLPFVG